MLSRIDSSFVDNGSLYTLCFGAQRDPHDAARNMEVRFWQDRPETLYNQLYIQKIYDGDKNGFYIYEKDNTVICCAGLTHIPEANACVMSRAYANHRVNKFTRVRNYTKFFYEIYDGVISKQYDAWINFFNEYNLAGRNVITNLNDSEDQYTRTNRIMKFVNYDRPVTYKYTKQFAAYHIVNGDDQKVLEYLDGIQS